MKKRLEELISDHRQRLEEVEAIDEDQLWIGINDNLPHKIDGQKIWLKLAAAIIFVLGSLLLYTYTQRSYQVQDVEALARNYFPELDQNINTLNYKIAARKTAMTFDMINPESYPELFEQMHMLQQDYQKALQDLSSLGKEEAILRVLMRYHQRQLDLLERLANEIEKKKIYEKRNSAYDIY